MPLVLLLLFLGRELSMYLVIRPLYMLRKLDPGAKLPGKIKTALQIGGSLVILVLLFLQQLDSPAGTSGAGHLLLHPAGADRRVRQLAVLVCPAPRALADPLTERPDRRSGRRA